jgi:hypothetical protein
MRRHGMDAAPIFAIAVFMACSNSGSNGTNGYSTLVEINAEAAGSSCANGGQKISAGFDSNGNGQLDASEATNTSFVCNGVNGANGTNGANGADGGPGTNGADVVVITTSEPLGTHCAAGGTKVVTGTDRNLDGLLADTEIGGVAYVCNGSAGAGGMSSLVSVGTEDPGANCVNGGQRVDRGLDSDASGMLRASEIQSTSYVCNGANGFDSLVGIVAEGAGSNCTSGGQKLEQGLDLNRNGSLDAFEVRGTSYVCDGVVGAPGAAGATGPIGASGATGATGPAGASGGGLSVVDNAGTVLGKYLYANDYRIEFLSSAGYLVWIDWDTTFSADRVWYTSSDCTGTAYFDSVHADETIFGKTVVWSPSKNSLMVPATVSETTGVSTSIAISALSTDDLTCKNYSPAVSTAGWLLTTITRASAGIPATITAPLHIQ